MNENEPQHDTERARLIRIERKLDIFGEIASAAIGAGAAFGAYHLVAADLGLGWLSGDIAALATFGFVGGWAWRGFRKF